jgi:RNA polymerase sigma-70 factor (ECF subfamily)
MAKLKPDPTQLVEAEVAALIARAQAGDGAAFTRLVAAYLPRIHAFAFLFVADIHAAQDLTQEALLRVYHALPSFRHEAQFSTWLFSVVRNLFRDQCKSRAARAQQSERPLHADALERESTGSSPEDHVIAAESHRQLLNALRELQPEFGETVLLVDVQGLSLDEAASLMGVKTGTIKSRLSRGRLHLRDLLVQKHIGPEVES